MERFEARIQDDKRREEMKQDAPSFIGDDDISELLIEEYIKNKPMPKPYKEIESDKSSNSTKQTTCSCSDKQEMDSEFKNCVKELNDDDLPEIKLDIGEFLDFDDKKSVSSQPKSKVSLKDFELLKLLGYGTYGRVFLARKKDNDKIYAIKVLDKKTLSK